jgi:FkbM family methyltransferase
MKTGKMKRLIKKIISKTGYSLNKIPIDNLNESPHSGSMIEGLKRMKSLGIYPTTVVDVGAAQGSWSKNILELWPKANFHLIEPLIENRTHLDSLQKTYPNIKYHLAVAGENEGEVNLLVSPDLDGSGVYGGDHENTRSVPVITIDSLGKKEKLLIKLDTHGYEVPILKGAGETLKNTELLVIEVYGFRISPTCLLFHELTDYIDTLGFRLIDIVDIMRRPGDNAFWQADAFYIRKDHPVFDKNSYA